MISPHTPPGTKVAFLYTPKQYSKRAARKPSGFRKGDVVTVVAIQEVASRHGFGVRIAEHHYIFCISTFHRLDLPESLTSLLTTQPLELEVAQ